MKQEIIKDLMEAVHDIAKIKGENEVLKKENEFLRGLLANQLNILPVSNKEVAVCQHRYCHIEELPVVICTDCGEMLGRQTEC